MTRAGAGDVAVPVPPTATYRLQIRPGFGFDEVASVAEHLAALGVSHAYLSPVLEATAGSTHGYDVVDHRRLSPQAGGAAAFGRMSAALTRAGLSAIADVVPNHMAVPTPVRLNEALWSVLRDGPGSPFAHWFDVDWNVEDHAILMPILGDRIGTVLARGEITVDAGGGPQHEPVLRYADHEFPLRPGTEHLPLDDLVDRQWYRLAWWRVGDDELNYRRFFDVDTLAAVRVEDPDVFDATHELLVGLVRDGRLTGLRIDHPDGLADPRGYLRRLADASGHIWVVVEKILEGEEELPGDWPCAGTTGYDALHQIGGLFVDPACAAPLAALLTELTGDPPEFSQVVEQAKREVVEGTLYAEVARLAELVAEIRRDDVSLRDHTRRQLHTAIVELLVAFDRYRAYVVPGEPAPAEAVEVVERAATLARQRVPADAQDTVDLVRDLVLDRPAGRLAFRGREVARRHEFVVRFQQTCGPVMAKGVEDTACYRWHRLVALNEVGGDPTLVGVPPEAFHGYAGRLQRDWPTTMTTLSTHDTKRSEDVRARLYALSELTVEWADAVRGWTEAAAPLRSHDGYPDPATVYLLWQTLVGTWDDAAISADRLVGYLAKATREAKLHTGWTRPNAAYDDAVAGFATGVLADTAVMESVGAFCAELDAPARVALLGQKLVQLTMPGVPDVYQGCEIVDLSLVDPDNRREVDFPARVARLRHLDRGEKPADLSDEKLLVTSRALRLRRDRPECFVGATSSYTPLATSTGNAVAFARGDATGPAVVTVATRLPVALDRRGGWDEHTLVLPAGTWHDLLGGADHQGGTARLSALLARFPVALLVRG